MSVSRPPSPTGPEADDAVIAQALRRSLVALIFIGALAAAIGMPQDALRAALVAEEFNLDLTLEIMKVVDSQLGAVARPARVRFVTLLPKTRSGKVLRRAIQAVCEGRDPGDLTTMDDPAALQQIKDQLAH